MPEAPIKNASAKAFTVPTDAPEADGTFAWNSTTLVLAEVSAGGKTGIGYSYTDAAAAEIVNGALAHAIAGHDAFGIPAAHEAMLRRIRNIGRAGLVATAISAVDFALWDLKGKLLGQPVISLLGAAREAVPVYDSGGFTSYPVPRLQEQLGGWAGQGMRWVKMKVGTHPEEDPARAMAARQVIGSAERSPAELRSIVAGGGAPGEIYRRLAELRDRYADLIRRNYPKIPRRVSGYNLDELLPGNGFNVARALAGSEGTCITVLEATLNLVHSPPERCVVIAEAL